MSISLPLVIEAVTLVDEAVERRRPIDIDAAAADLIAGHPKSDAGPEDVTALLRQEQETVAGTGKPG